MADPSPRSPLRLLAPAALAVVAVVFLIVVAFGLGGGSDDQTPPQPADTSTGKSTSTAAAKPPKPKPAVYTIKAGDNLGSIAQKTEVPVEKLQELNPELDSQALVSGQKIKLRE